MPINICNMRFYYELREADSLRKKGISHIIEVKNDEVLIDGISKAWEYVNELSESLSRDFGFKIGRIVFMGNEDIGSRYILYRFRLYINNRYIGCRIVTFLNRHIQTILTVSEGLL